MARRYVPDAGHIVWVDFTPQSGHEQAGRRPALVLSPAAYNDKTGLCPMTSQTKGYPFEVTIEGKSPGRGPAAVKPLRRGQSRRPN